MVYNNPKLTKIFRQKLRKSMTDEEIILWSKIKNRQILDCKFRRQYGVGKYILDFYCHEIKLGLEIDGSGHYLSKDKIDYDKHRTYFLNDEAILIVRFTNIEIRKQLNDVLNFIYGTIERIRNKKDLPDWVGRPHPC